MRYLRFGKWLEQTLEIYRFVYEEAVRNNPDVYIESGWVTPTLANRYSHTFRYGDEDPVFNRVYPLPGFMEHIDYAAYQQAVLGQRSNMGAPYGDANDSIINRWWLQAALALGAGDHSVWALCVCLLLSGIGIGTTFHLRQTGSLPDRTVEKGRVARIDLDVNELNHSRVPLDLSINADARAALTALDRALPKPSGKTGRSACGAREPMRRRDCSRWRWSAPARSTRSGWSKPRRDCPSMRRRERSRSMPTTITPG